MVPPSLAAADCLPKHGANPEHRPALQTSATRLCRWERSALRWIVMEAVTWVVAEALAGSS